VTRDECREFIVEHCIEHSRPGRPILSPGGRQQSWQLFLRRALYDAYFSLAVGQAICDELDLRFGAAEYQLAGLETGAVPLLITIAQESLRRGFPRTIFSVRKEPKAYGIFNRMEGRPRRGVPVVMIDDFVHLGRSLYRCEAALKAEGFTVAADAYCVVADKAAAAAKDLSVHPIFTLEEIGLRG